ncbi:MAG TPA: GNAT family N-acetyltransferase [Spirochaetia bacterium]|nr:GNAT family N-acetyltransferase [Spirochaetia bacterium]
MADHSIRTAQRADLDLISPLFDAYRQFYGRPPDPEGSRGFLRERLEGGDSTIFIAFDGRTPTGFCQLYPSFSSVSIARILILNDLFVTPVGRRRGVGRELLHKAAEYGSSIGATRLTLTTGLENHPAQGLYRNCGWEQDREFLTFNLQIPGR